MPVNLLHYRLSFEGLLQYTIQTLSFYWRCAYIIPIIIQEQAVQHQQWGQSYISNSRSSGSVTVSVRMDTPTAPIAPNAPGLLALPSASASASAAGLTSQVSASSNLTQQTSVTTVTSMYSVTSRRQLYQVTNNQVIKSDYYKVNNTACF